MENRTRHARGPVHNFPILYKYSISPSQLCVPRWDSSSVPDCLSLYLNLKYGKFDHSDTYSLNFGLGFETNLKFRSANLLCSVHSEPWLKTRPLESVPLPYRKYSLNQLSSGGLDERPSFLKISWKLSSSKHLIDCVLSIFSPNKRKENRECLFLSVHVLAAWPLSLVAANFFWSTDPCGRVAA